jgi:hypothetical protein
VTDAEDTEDTKAAPPGAPDAPATPGLTEPSAPPAAPAASDDLVLDTLWGRVLEAWDEEKPHSAVLDYALRSKLLPELAGRYRALADDPEKGARARKKIDGIVVAATQMMLSTKTPKMEKPPPYLTWTAFLIFVFVLGVLWYALTKH